MLGAFGHPVATCSDMSGVVGSNLKPQPNDGDISTQYIATLLAQHLQAPAKRSQQFKATDRNIAFGHPVATCWDMLRVENRANVHTQAQHCFTNLAKRLQHHATPTNVA